MPEPVDFGSERDDAFLEGERPSPETAEKLRHVLDEIGFEQRVAGLLRAYVIELLADLRLNVAANRRWLALH